MIGNLQNLLGSIALTLCVLTACATSAQEEPTPPPTPPPTPVDPSDTADGDAHPDATGEAQPKPPAEAANPTKPQVVELLTKIEKAAEPFDTFRARFRYIVIQGNLSAEEHRFGELYYRHSDEEQPIRIAVKFDRLRIDGSFRKMETWFVSDGRWLLERDHIDKSATRREIAPAGAEARETLTLGDDELPIPIKIKSQTLLESFQVVRLEDSKDRKGRILIHLRMTPLKNAKDTEPYDAWFYEDTLLPREVKGKNGPDHFEFLLSDVDPDAKIDDGVFDTSLPKEKGWNNQEVPLGR